MPHYRASRAPFFSTFAAALLAAIGAGCGQGDLPPSATGGPGIGPSPGTPGSPGYTSLAAGPCAVEDEVRECYVTIGQHAGITNCFHGVQRCAYGAWTECADGEYSVTVAADRTDAELVDAFGKPEGRKFLDQDLHFGHADKPATPVVVPGADGALANPMAQTTSSCNDACDPTCRKIIESGPFASGGQTVSSWAASTKFALANAKSGLLGNLWTEPCTVGTDCEFGMHCTDPVTTHEGGVCAHNKCAVGTAFSAACDDACVATVCAINPDCCAYAGSCGHSPCVTGAALTCNVGAGADPAVASVCANPAFATCCTTGWTAACVTQYGVDRGLDCPSNPSIAWTSPKSDSTIASQGMTCTQLVHDACGVICPDNTPTCEHDVCATGSGMTGSCDPCVQAVCNAPGGAGCCGAGGTWSQACINLVPSACGKACAPPAGACQEFLPNQVDTSCLGPDLVTSVPCWDNGGTATPPPLNPAVPSCTTDSQCGSTSNSGYVCSGNACVAGCRNGTGCPSGQTCTSTNSTAGSCIQYKVPGATSSQGYITLCNHGTQPTPPGAAVTINVYSGNSGQPNKFQGSPTNKAPTFSCSTTQISTPPPQVLPGKCVDVPCPTGTNDEIYVNPPNPTAPYASTPQVTECGGKQAAYKNNWSLNLDTGNNPSNKVSCDAPQCSPTIGTVRSLSDHIVIEAEHSQLMSANAKSGIPLAINAFFNLQQSQQLLTASASKAQVGTFPGLLTNCTATGIGSCAAPPACVDTVIGMASMSSSLGALYTALLTGLLPLSMPPYITGFAGALDAARTDQLKQTSNNGWYNSVVLILGSDLTAAGNNYCGTTLTAMTGLAAQYWTLYKIRTFVIAIGGAKLSTAKAIATAGGGYGYYVSDDSNIVANVTSALRKTQALTNAACTYDLPPTSLFDINAATVSFAAPSGTTNPTNYRYMTLMSVTPVQPASTNWASSYNTYLEACLANCGNVSPPPAMGTGTTPGWCYDDPVAPTRIVLCQNTCEVMAGDPWASATSGGSPHGNAYYRLGCPLYYGTNTFSPLGSYVGSFCDSIPGTKPLWSYFGYNTTDPTDTSVDFQFQTADRTGGACPAQASFPAPLAYTVTADSTKPLAVFGSATSPPIDLVNAIQGGKATGPLLADCMNLNFTLNPNPQHTLSPTVNSYELRYSCPYTE